MPWYSSCDENSPNPSLNSYVRLENASLNEGRAVKRDEKQTEYSSVGANEGSSFETTSLTDPLHGSPLRGELPHLPIPRARAGSDRSYSLLQNNCPIPTPADGERDLSTHSASTSFEETRYSVCEEEISFDSESACCDTSSSSNTGSDEVQLAHSEDASDLCYSPGLVTKGRYDDIMATLDYKHAEVAVMKQEYRQILENLQKKLE